MTGMRILSQSQKCPLHTHAADDVLYPFSLVRLDQTLCAVESDSSQ